MKTIKYLSLIFFLSFIVNKNTTAQVINYDFNTPLNEQHNYIFNIDNYLYFTYDICYTPFVLHSKHLIIFKTTTEGLIVDSLKYEVEQGYILHTIIEGPDKCLFAFNYRGGNEIDYGSFIVKKINTNLQIIENKEYFTKFHGLNPQKPYLINDKIYLYLGGCVNCYPYIPSPYKKYLIDHNCDTVFSEAVDPGLLICKLINIPNEDNYFNLGGCFVSKVDSNLNNIWPTYKFLGMDFYFYYNSGAFWKDDTTLTLINSMDYWLSMTVLNRQIGIVNTDTSFNNITQNVQYFGETNTMDHLGYTISAIQLNNGDYLVGSYNSEYFWDYFYDLPNEICIRRITPDLNLVWEKTISGGDSAYYLANLVAIENGFIISGTKNYPYDSVPNYDIFLYKFDYNGNYYQIMELPGGEVSARVYPNPGQDYFTLKCYENFSGADLLLHDMAGHKVIQQKITSPTMEIITTDLLPGTYIYSIQKNGKTVYSGKWVKR